MEKVIVIGVDSEGSSFAACVSYKDDQQLETEVYSRFDCNDFLVFYEESIDDLEDALEDFYTVTTPASALTPADRRTIRTMMRSGDFSQKEVAANYGVCRQTIGKICKE